MPALATEGAPPVRSACMSPARLQSSLKLLLHWTAVLSCPASLAVTDCTALHSPQLHAREVALLARIPLGRQQHSIALTSIGHEPCRPHERLAGRSFAPSMLRCIAGPQELLWLLSNKGNFERGAQCLKNSSAFPGVTLTCLVCGPAEDVGGVSIACQGWLGSGQEPGSAR